MTDKRVSTNIRLDFELWQQAKIKAIKEQKKIYEYISDLIRKDLAKK